MSFTQLGKSQSCWGLGKVIGFKGSNFWLTKNKVSQHILYISTQAIIYIYIYIYNLKIMTKSGILHQILLYETKMFLNICFKDFSFILA